MTRRAFFTLGILAAPAPAQSDNPLLGLNVPTTFLGNGQWAVRSFSKDLAVYRNGMRQQPIKDYTFAPVAGRTILVTSWASDDTVIVDVML